MTSADGDRPAGLTDAQLDQVLGAASEELLDHVKAAADPGRTLAAIMSLPAETPVSVMIRLRGAGTGGARELTVQEASALAIDAHDGQLEMYGAPYHEHLRAVAEALTPYGPQMVMAGWLHDILDGTEWTAGELREAGVPARVVEIVELVTPGSDYLDSIRRITQDPEATLVKIADNADSIHPERITGTPDAETRRRLAEFEEARRILWSAAPREEIIKVVSPINRPLLDRLTAA
jgi:(p)ppGpp synthase/HD superfamily hydrolase